MKPSVNEHPWSENSLYAKAQLYKERMESHPPEAPQFALWSALSLELLARAALSHISPVLLAETGKWGNLAYAIDGDFTDQGFFPKSASTREVLSRLQKLVPELNDETIGFCRQHIERRNSELHTGDLPFEKLGTSQWLPRFYLACDAILQSMGKALEEFVSKPEESRKMMGAFNDQTASAVKGDITAHKKVWSNKSKDQKDGAVKEALAWATRQAGHRVQCPACGCQSLVHGEPIGKVKRQVNGDTVLQKQSMLPTSFKCIACGLQISGLSKLSVSGLGDVFTATHRQTIADYFGLYTEEDLEEARSSMSEQEPDFNE